MTDIKDQQEQENKPGQVSRPKRLELKKTVEKGQVKQSFSHGRSKMVTVEVRKKRTYTADARGRLSEVQRGIEQERTTQPVSQEPKPSPKRPAAKEQPQPRKLTSHEMAIRARVLKDALRAEEEPRPSAKDDEIDLADSEAVVSEGLQAEAAAPAEAQPATSGDAGDVTTDLVSPPEEQPSSEAGALEQGTPVAEATPETPAEETPAAGDHPVEEGVQATVEAEDVAAAKTPDVELEPVAEDQQPTPAEAPTQLSTTEAQTPAETAEEAKPSPKVTPQALATKSKGPVSEDEEADDKARTRRPSRNERRTPAAGRRDEHSRRSAKLSVSEALEGGGESERMRSLASVRRAREKERQKYLQSLRSESIKVVREVIVPETITVQELANRMAERSGAVIKSLMKMGVMATINQAIDADTAELIVSEFGHKAKRVSEADVEIGLKGDEDESGVLLARPPVVTVMGHVDHGKTSLLDALRKTDVADREAGGITQHIGAYQVTLATGEKITFIDTPGHAAFTDMRARGARVTDVVILVVAADDGVMPQTIEAIAHARAANVPMIIAVNKSDLPDANAQRIRTDLLQHNVVVEDMGGETLVVDVSAKTGAGLDKLAEAIVLQSEILDLKANPDRPADGVIIESKIERGRGTVATVLVQRGTLRVGDIFVAGSEWGRVRSLTDANGKALKLAIPGQPAEVLGLNGTPAAGDDVVVVETEARAREVTEFRQRRHRDAKAAPKRGTLQQMLDQIGQGEVKSLALVIKADVHGSVEAIAGALEKLATEEVSVNILHSGVGGINESDVTLARASDAVVIGFNVRANPQARDQAKRDGIEVRYFSIIYDLIDSIKQTLTGMMAPVFKEKLLGYAEIREIFNITKVGKVAGCMVTEGMIRRGGRVRLLRDDVVIHEGDLGQLKRFKDDAKEVKEGYDCGISLANYQDIQVGDKIECFELEEQAPVA